MFKEKTTFIIGAGSGVDIDMPTGKMLIEQIASHLQFRSDGGRMTQGNGDIRQAISRASTRHKIDTNSLISAAHAIVNGAHHMGSIDSYIHAHSDDECIKICGKIAIVHTILQYERNCAVYIDPTKMPPRFNNETKVRASWYDTFMGLLVGRVIAKQNLDNIFDNVAIINFNYDRCLEQYLCLSMQRSFRISADRAAELMSKLLIHHPYGVLAKLPWQNKSTGIHLGGDPYGNENDLEKLSHNIKTFNEEVERSNELDSIKAFLAESKRTIFLGFHFHNQNVDLITPDFAVSKGVRHAYVSTYGRKEPELQIIEAQVRAIFHLSSYDTSVHMNVPECRLLLESYGTTLIS
jgi:hypothetical protein